STQLMGRPRQSPLAPLPWSDARARVLAAVLLASDGLHLQAIAERAGVPYSVVQREVDRLERAHVVESKKLHTARVVRANIAHPLFAELRALLLKAYGPVEIMRELLVVEPGIKVAYLFGSWAARYEGRWGEPPADIDVLVVGELPVRRVESIEVEAEDTLGQPVQITVVPPEEWRSRGTAFVRTVRQRPLVPIVDESE
ncbi:MAG: ArsR family transcriptional regulator, partial [Thermoplasmata archaeon]